MLHIRTRGLSAALGGQWQHIANRANDAPFILVGNAVLMTAAWFLLPRSWLFTWTGATGYTLALSTWMFSDVLSTNVLGGDAARGLAALNDPAALKDFLRARTIVLWCLTAPLCVVIAVVIGLEVDHWLYTLATIVVVTILPLGALPACSLIGIRYPYHPRPFAWRWQHRHEFRHVIVRWVALVLVPYWPIR